MFQAKHPMWASKKPGLVLIPLVFLLLGCELGNALLAASSAESRRTAVPPTLLVVSSSTPHDSQTLLATPTAPLANTMPPSNEEPTAEAAPTGVVTVPLPLNQSPAWRATARAQPLADYLAVLVDQGYLNAMEGRYYQLADFDQSLARMGEWALFTSGHSPKNFVLRAQLTWESASDRANWDWAGCGFAFRRNQNNGEYYAVHLGLDGAVYAWYEVGGVLKRAQTLFSQRYPVEVPRGSAEMALIVENAYVTALVNEQLVFRDYEGLLNSRLADGDLAYLIRSGSNAGFGTRCLMRQVQLWEFVR